MTTNTTSPTPIYDRVSAALGFNPVPGQPTVRSTPVRVKKRPEPTVVREAVQPTEIRLIDRDGTVE
jgi:hypothetical protein